MANKGLAFSLGGSRKPQAARLQTVKAFKGNALSAFEAPGSDDEAETPVQPAKRQRTEPAGCCVFQVLSLYF